MKLNEKDKQLISNISTATNVILNDKSVFVKQTSRYEFEMLGYSLARLLDIKSPSCTIVQMDNPYVISEDLNTVDKFDLISELTTIKSESIKDIHNNLYNVKIEQLIKVYLYDILFQNCDRNKSNYGIIRNDIYIIDNESIFDLYDIPVLTSSFKHIITLDVDKVTYLNIIKYEISTFLLNFGEYKYLLKDMIFKISPSKLKCICDSLNIKKQTFMSFYIKVYYEIFNIVNLDYKDLIKLNDNVLKSDLREDKLLIKSY